MAWLPEEVMNDLLKLLERRQQGEDVLTDVEAMIIDEAEVCWRNAKRLGAQQRPFPLKQEAQIRNLHEKYCKNPDSA